MALPVVTPASAILRLSSPSSGPLSFTAATSPRFPLPHLACKPHPPLFLLTSLPLLRPCAALQEPPPALAAKELAGTNRRRLFVANLPREFSASEVEALFRQCGAVEDVEFLLDKSGRSRGFAFVTMTSKEEAQAAVDRFDSHEVLEKIIRVQYAKTLNKPAPPPASPPVDAGANETQSVVYASNLAWKARSRHLKELFSANFKPVSARVVFESPSGRSAGYGFVSFATEEEAENAISELNGKELMGRPLRLKISERKGHGSGLKK